MSINHLENTWGRDSTTFFSGPLSFFLVRELTEDGILTRLSFVFPILFTIWMLPSSIYYLCYCAYRFQTFLNIYVFLLYTSSFKLTTFPHGEIIFLGDCGPQKFPSVLL